jgi:hypothetical protein
VARFYNQFEPLPPPAPRTYRPQPRIWTRDAIRLAYERRRKGQISDADWAKLEESIIAAAREGRVAGALPLSKNYFTDGR